MFNLASKILISIGAKGQRPDIYPSTIVSDVTPGTSGNGRPTRFADVVYAAKTREGKEILKLRMQHDLGFAFPARAEINDLLDGTPDAPLSVNELLAKYTEQTLEFLASRPAAVESMDLDTVDA